MLSVVDVQERYCPSYSVSICGPSGSYMIAFEGLQTDRCNSWRTVQKNVGKCLGELEPAGRRACSRGACTVHDAAVRTAYVLGGWQAAMALVDFEVRATPCPRCTGSLMATASCFLCDDWRELWPMRGT